MRNVALYSYWRSSCSWRVRTVLHFKGIAFETRPVHLVRDGGEQRTEDYRARNPMAQVPFLQWESPSGETHSLGQSMAIALMLEAHAPSPALLPPSPFARARAVEMAEVINAGIQPLQNLSVLERVESMGADRAAWASMWIAGGLAALEQMARAIPGPYLGGAQPSLADVFSVPQLYNARRFSLDLASYPRLLEAESACQALPAFVAAHPSAQPDAPQGSDA